MLFRYFDIINDILEIFRGKNFIDISYIFKYYTICIKFG